MKSRFSNARVTLMVLLTATVLTSCLSTEVSIDLSRGDTFSLDIVYRMPRSLWEYGVFDEENSERAVPVSRRDAEETAVLYSDVTVTSYEIDEHGDEISVTVSYRIGSVESLEALWGGVSSGSRMSLSLEAGTLRLPVGEGPPPEGYDQEQAQLISRLFENEVFSITIRTPGRITSSTFPEAVEQDTEASRSGGSSADEVATWQVAMGDLLLAPGSKEIVLAWE
ncbi:MAG: hypothetical protein ACOCYQ_01280 [Alkalispirochaeta sp.]